MPVTFQKHARVATITLDDGKANAITTGTLAELDRILDEVDADDEVGALLIAGRAGRFSAGFDLAAMTGSRETMVELVVAGGRFLARLLLEPRPVVLACTGHALAMGGLMLLAADHRVGAAGPFKIGLNEVAIGMAMPRWGVELARYRLSPTQLEWRLVLGQTGSPDEAVTAGFLDRVVPAEDVLEEAGAVAARLSELDTAAVGGTKKRLRGRVVERMLEDLEADLSSVSVPSAG